MQQTIYWNVILLYPPYRSFTYEVPNFFPKSILKRGLRVFVPIRNKICVGILDTPAEPPKKAKEIIYPLENKVFLSAAYLDIIHELNLRQMNSPGEILNSIIPSPLISPDLKLIHTETGISFGAKDLAQLTITTKQNLLIDTLSGALVIQKYTARENFNYQLAISPPWPILPRAHAQIKILDFLYINGICSLNKLKTQATTTSINTLLKKNYITKISCADTVKKKINSSHICLSTEQKNIVENFEKLLNEQIMKVALLFGITGSGKTYIYLELIKKVLSQGKSVILLAPEVAIAIRLYEIINNLIDNYTIILYHGYLSPYVKAEHFEQSKQNIPQLFIGTRSAIFLPSPNLGLIILDEEHDSSYKQDEQLIYNTKDIAYFRMQQANGLLLFGSATPDIRTMHAANTKKIELRCLHTRIHERPLPEIKLINMNAPEADGLIISPTVSKNLRDILDRGEQAIIMHNRRGYAPILYCIDCKQIIRCSKCKISMTYHKNIGKLLCHYCGSNMTFPTPCECGSTHFTPLGIGTEKLTEDLKVLFPQKGDILRLDRDSVRKKDAFSDIMQQFSSGQSKILIGTQMVSKGLDFPNVTLVVVIDGDLNLNLPDYRAPEKMFQMLVQVAGRAGRGGKPGKVLIQTKNPHHSCWQYIINTDYQNFCEQELEIRQKYNYPPFTRLGIIRFNFPINYIYEKNILKSLSTTAQNYKNNNIQILGPAPSPLSILRGRLRYQYLIKAENWQLIRNFYKIILQKLVPFKSHIRIQLDLDPENMM